MLKEYKKQLLKNVLAEVVKDLCGIKSQSVLSVDSDLSSSTINYLIRAKKDPQLSTLWALAEGLGLKMSQFIMLMEDKCPENFSMVDDLY